MAEGEQRQHPPRRRRRSHLKSATYRSVLRLFSLLPPLTLSPLSAPYGTTDATAGAPAATEKPKGAGAGAGGGDHLNLRSGSDPKVSRTDLQQPAETSQYTIDAELRNDGTRADARTEADADGKVVSASNAAELLLAGEEESDPRLVEDELGLMELQKKLQRCLNSEMRRENPPIECGRINETFARVGLDSQEEQRAVDKTAWQSGPTAESTEQPAGVVREESGTINHRVGNATGSSEEDLDLLQLKQLVVNSRMRENATVPLDEGPEMTTLVATPRVETAPRDGETSRVLGRETLMICDGSLRKQPCLAHSRLGESAEECTDSKSVVVGPWVGTSPSIREAGSTMQGEHLVPCISTSAHPGWSGKVGEQEDGCLVSKNSMIRTESMESIEISENGLADDFGDGETEEGEIVNEPDDNYSPCTGDDAVSMGTEKVSANPSSLHSAENENYAISQPTASTYRGDLLAQHGVMGKLGSRSGEGHLLDYGDLDLLKGGRANGHSSIPSIKREPTGTKKKGKSKASEYIHAGTSAETSENLSDPSNRKKTRTKDVGVSGKKKCVITEERKAKKKLAKKRKRAETNKKLGVKKLKIKPVSVPKKVVYCSFYLKGRCQQGPSCKFSHDITPLTKSQPCKYFACNSCLKGDECPFDHELGKYPCHNFMAKGFCSRGEACKFSHKIPAAGNSAESINKHDSSPAVENLFPSNHLKKNVSTHAGVSDVTMSAMLEPPNSINKSKLADKSPPKAPKGIYFLSFDNNLPTDADKPQMVPTSGVGHAIGMPNRQNNVEPSILQRSVKISAAMPWVCPSLFVKQMTSISTDSHASVQSTRETSVGVAKSPIPGCLPGKTAGKGTVNIYGSLSAATSAAGGTHSKITEEAARLLDEFLFHDST